MNCELPPEWSFNSTIITPDGIRFDVTIVVPVSEDWPEVVEVSELAQMSAASAIAAVKRTREQAFSRSEKVPF